MHAHLVARITALALVVSLSACEATTVGSAPWNTPPLVAGVRADFKRHWAELTADPSPAAARTRALIVSWALREDPPMLTMLQARESLTAIVARATADAERAALNFPDASDVWLTLAQLRRASGDIDSAEKAACRAYEIDRSNVDAHYICGERPRADKSDPWTSADRALAKQIEASDLHVALRKAEARVDIVCKRSAVDMSWAELVTCGDDDATHGRRDVARLRYRAAALTTANADAQFLALQRYEELEGSCADVLQLLPYSTTAAYARWKTSLAAQIRPPLRIER